MIMQNDFYEIITNQTIMTSFYKQCLKIAYVINHATRDKIMHGQMAAMIEIVS